MAEIAAQEDVAELLELCMELRDKIYYAHEIRVLDNMQKLVREGQDVSRGMRRWLNDLAERARRLA